ncbi:L-rhamnonate dehydratase [Sphingosinicella terrae]|uniref:L-rhamnonate dehydratase n=1 Tax=Sphingosinicella terrae TaxID=2172047 RepID=UPI000E0CC4C7|nr:L-rhamnonate dehydratase [Sphingosinicella terrae]
MTLPKITHVRAYTVRGGGADYHDQSGDHWIDDHIATPMSDWPEYRRSRRSFGIDVLGTLIVELEAEDGTIGFAVTTGGEPAAFVVEKHFARFIEGRSPDDREEMWEQMYRASLFYGRKGLVVNALSGVDLALWDLAGRLRGEPVHHMLGGAVRDEIAFYATGSRPDLAKAMGFVGGKIPLHHGPAEGEEGLASNLADLAAMRDRVGPDFPLMLDCWMALDLDYAVRLATGAHALGLHWIEEALPPDDYWGYAELKRRVPEGLLVTTGEHEATRWGFRMLVEMDCCDIVQPDVGWCGGLSELVRIADHAEGHGKAVVPHGSSVYSYHFIVTRQASPFAEYLMMAPAADRVVPMFAPQLLGEPVPEQGRLRLSALDRPGFGVELNRDLPLHRPYSH